MLTSFLVKENGTYASADLGGRSNDTSENLEDCSFFSASWVLDNPNPPPWARVAPFRSVRPLREAVRGP